MKPKLHGAPYNCFTIKQSSVGSKYIVRRRHFVLVHQVGDDRRRGTRPISIPSTYFGISPRKVGETS